MHANDLEGGFLKSIEKPSIYDYFRIVQHSDEEFDATLSTNQKFISLENKVEEYMHNPDGPLGDVLANLYEPEVLLYKLEKKIQHPMLPGFYQILTEIKSIGFLKWNEEIIGCAKIACVINPVPSFLDTSLYEFISDKYVIDSELVGDETGDVPFYIDLFLEDHEEDIQFFFDIIKVTPKFYKNIQNKNLYAQALEKQKKNIPELLHHQINFS